MFSQVVVLSIVKDMNLVVWIFYLIVVMMKMISLLVIKVMKLFGIKIQLLIKRVVIFQMVLYFPTTQQRWQVQTYGYLLAKNGHDVKRVSLVAIARDGDERDIKVHTEDYDESVALQALNWLAAILT